MGAQTAEFGALTYPNPLVRTVCDHPAMFPLSMLGWGWGGGGGEVATMLPKLILLAISPRKRGKRK